MVEASGMLSTVEGRDVILVLVDAATFERRPLGGGAFALVPTDLESLGVVACFSERTGGSSAAPFDSLNASFSVGDPAERVLDNRRRIALGIGTGPFAVAGLVHGSRIERVDRTRAGAGFEDRGGVIEECDGLVTTTPGVALAVTSADCVPMVFASAAQRELAVVHAGWRGIAAGIVDRALALYEDAAKVRVAIGPAVGPDHYEVGEEVARAVAQACGGGARIDRRGGRLRLDLVATIRAALDAAGVARVSDTGVCTACEPARFFSHRRDGLTGRQLALAMRAA
jgi:purine-nucleoside/S-methyl-5'-thioadenosine phosphorylase / adenosine deaminase